MSQSGRGGSCDVQDKPEELVESESETEDEAYEPPQNEKPPNERFGQGHLGSLDDVALIDMLKKSVVYLDFLNTGLQQLPPRLPRISVWKGDMIKERSKADCVQGCTYGKCQFNIYYVQVLPLKSTCYYKKSESRTPSPTCVIDGATFKKTLSETVDGTMSSKTINDITELYMKHSAGHNESASKSAQNIIVDVIGYFYQRAQHDKRSSGSDCG
ncbi:uncharacterized protein LOC120695329 [Panicum virgatum]|uniref:uncharacterized protein LOC120695329 n=1 Tax=Panicum virgatum TaxID=38727 RepID=UPI0019D5D2FD|nr:uncharacterized protein LOC120695329 [Panicum virgatum]